MLRDSSATRSALDQKTSPTSLPSSLWHISPSLSLLSSPFEVWLANEHASVSFHLCCTTPDLIYIKRELQNKVEIIALTQRRLMPKNEIRSHCQTSVEAYKKVSEQAASMTLGLASVVITWIIPTDDLKVRQWYYICQSTAGKSTSLKPLQLTSCQNAHTWHCFSAISHLHSLVQTSVWSNPKCGCEMSHG